MRRKGFTLAEVLITLGIIGVVAALTIPTLINNYQKQEYVVGLKKAYAEFNQALAQFANDNGCPGDLKCTGFFETTSSSDDFANEIGKYFKGAKMDPFQYSWEISPVYDKLAAGSTYYIRNPKFITSSGISYSIANSGYHDCSNVWIKYYGSVM